MVHPPTEDFEATKMAGAFIKTWIESLLFYIHNVSFPEWWSRSLVQQILHTYKAVVHPTKLTWDPNTGVADCADAILNGFQLSIPSLRNKQSCWAHIWRFVMNKAPSLMVDATPAKSDLLFENLCFLQEVPYIFGVSTIAIKERLITLFKVKWAATDPTLVTYLEKEVLARYFFKCHSRQGKPSNTNTLERFTLEGVAQSGLQVGREDDLPVGEGALHDPRRAQNGDPLLLPKALSTRMALSTSTHLLHSPPLALCPRLLRSEPT